MAKPLARIAWPFVLARSACASPPGTALGPQAAMARFRAAFNAQDAAGVAAVFGAQAQLLPPGKPVAGKDTLVWHRSAAGERAIATDIWNNDQ